MNTSTTGLDLQVVFHVSDRTEWERAVATGTYTSSTRGLDLAEVGFIHFSTEAQYPTVLEVHYANATDLVLLHVDVSKLTSELRYEDVPGTDAPFPHLYGALNIDAVVEVTPLPDPPRSRADTPSRRGHRTRPGPDVSSPDRSMLRIVLVAVAIGALFGPLDLAGQVHAPYPLANLFNSPAVWAAAAFGFGVWAQRRMQAVLGAIVMEVVAVIAYYLADVVGGSDSSIIVSTTALAWVVLGIGAGAIFGAAGAAAADDQSTVLRAAGNALLPGVLLAEASHQMIRHLTTDADSRPDDLISIAIMLTALATATLTWRLHGRTSAERAHTLGVTLAVAAVGSVAFAVLTG